jgi:hypothetical protein
MAALKRGGYGSPPDARLTPVRPRLKSGLAPTRTHSALELTPTIYIFLQTAAAPMHLITYSRVLQLGELGLRIEGESRGYELQISSRSSLCSRCGAVDRNAAFRRNASGKRSGPAV